MQFTPSDQKTKEEGPFHSRFQQATKDVWYVNGQQRHAHTQRTLGDIDITSSKRLHRAHSATRALCSGTFFSLLRRGGGGRRSTRRPSEGSTARAIGGGGDRSHNTVAEKTVEGVRVAVELARAGSMLSAGTSSVFLPPTTVFAVCPAGRRRLVAPPSSSPETGHKRSC